MEMANFRIVAVCKTLLFMTMIVIMFAMGKKCGQIRQRRENGKISLPIYEQCHDNFKTIPDVLKEKFRIRDHYSELLRKDRRLTREI